MYIAGLVIPVPEEKLEAHRQWAENCAAIFKRYGCLDVVQAWEDFVVDGKQTGFRRAVAAAPGEKIVFAWQIWPDKESLDAAEIRMHEHGVLDAAGAFPFDARRLILGCFRPIATMGRA